MLIIKHLIDYCITLLLASLVIFFVLEILPGDPAIHILGLNASEQALQSLRDQLNLNAPLWQRYSTWITNFFHGDFGMSYRYQVPVLELISERVVITFPLTLLTMMCSGFLGFFLAFVAAHNHHKKSDIALSAISEIGLAIPEFWVGILLIFGLAIPFAILPIGGFPGWEKGVFEAGRHLILPTIALSVMQTAILFRYARAVVIQIQNEDYIKSSIAFGLARHKVTLNYIFPMAILPIFSLLGMQITSLLTGAIIIETVFNIPGIGQLLLQAVEQRDLTVIKTLVMMFITFVVFIHFIIDILHQTFDPRLSLDKHRWT